jgi:pSer/pThr/pTyr-binding forkhead associated (FHA) protein
MGVGEPGASLAFPDLHHRTSRPGYAGGVSYRDVFEQCPRCSVALVDAGSVRSCRNCGGMWVEEAVLTEMVLKMLPPRPLSRLVLAVLERTGAPIGCPACHEAMDSTTIQEVMLDRCAKHGIWFDALELETALHRVAEPESAPPLEDIPYVPSVPRARSSPEGTRRAAPDSRPSRSAASSTALPELVFVVRSRNGQGGADVRIRDTSIIKVGKLASAQLRIDDRSVSRMHALIEANAADDVTIIDLGSTVGTYVNGERINKTRLRSGDRITLGDTEVDVTIVES